jgi:hypothetical protein
MILSISKDQTTLYDQIRYQGAPASFAWVLPISGTVNVGLSADVVFSALDNLTQTTVVAPPLNCPPLPASCTQRGGLANAAPAQDSAGAGGSVTVTKHEVVGPYDTVQLHSTDANALENWLTTNQFTIPDDIKPVIAQYVTEHFDFLALKLIPGKGIQDMRPVRVTTTGASAVLPLRMVAAGTAATVGVSLWVLGEGRYEPQNFPSFFIKTEDLVWDWTQQKSNYVELRAAQEQATGGKGWELESSIVLYEQQIQQQVEGGYYYSGGAGGGGAPAPDPAYAEQQAQQDYLPVTDGNGAVLKTAVQVRDEDLATLFYGIPTATGRVTRMRADLAHTALDADLVMSASQDQGFLQNVRQVTRELNEPSCPVYSGCTQVGTAPRSQAVEQSSPSNESFSCSTAASPRGGVGWLGASGAFLALAIGKVIRRRRQR